MGAFTFGLTLVTSAVSALIIRQPDAVRGPIIPVKDEAGLLGPAKATLVRVAVSARALKVLVSVFMVFSGSRFLLARISILYGSIGYNLFIAGNWENPRKLFCPFRDRMKSLIAKVATRRVDKPKILR